MVKPQILRRMRRCVFPMSVFLARDWYGWRLRDSSYHSLQASVTRRLSKGLRLQASYTWSKSLDNNSGSGTGATFTGVDGDQTRLSLNRGPSDFDRTNRFVLNFSYQVPNWGYGLKDTAVGKRLFGGWQLAGVTILQSGTPFSILDTSGAALYGPSSSRASWAPGATIESAQSSGRTQDRLNKYFNTAAFVRSGDLFGDSSRNLLRGPSQNNLDFSISKMIPIREKINMEWRTEFLMCSTTPTLRIQAGALPRQVTEQFAPRRATPE